jgi:hypothetical protein
MVVDFDVAARLHLEVKEAVAREGVEHVVEKGDAGGDFREPAAVQRQLDADGGLAGLAFHGRAAIQLRHPCHRGAGLTSVHYRLPARCVFRCQLTAHYAATSACSPAS